MMSQRIFRILSVLLSATFLCLLLAGCFLVTGEPTAVLSSATVTGSVPLEVGFNLSFSSHSKNLPMTYELDFGDGSAPVLGSDFDIILLHTYGDAGTYEATLTVSDEHGTTDTDTLTITADGAGLQVGIEIGNIAPDFTGHTTEGETMALSDYLGNVVILDFWGSWCEPCKNSMPELDNLVTKFGAQGLVVVTVSTDISKQDTIDFLASRGLTQFVSVWEPGGKTGNPIDLLYEVTFYPTTFVLDRQGVIRWISIGYPMSVTDAMLESLL